MAQNRKKQIKKAILNQHKRREVEKYNQTQKAKLLQAVMKVISLMRNLVWKCIKVRGQVQGQ